MRKRFEDELELGIKLISDTPVLLGSRDEFPALVMALLTLYNSVDYRDKVLDIIEDAIMKGKKRTGCPGLNLWQIFVLAEVRLGLNLNYDRLASMVHSDSVLRQLLGIESETSFRRIDIKYQRIVDNVHLLNDKILRKINQVIVSFAHNITGVKTDKLRLKSDSFVVEINVHFPTDYNLLFDSARKALGVVKRVLVIYPEIIDGWRKLENWNKILKNKAREIGVIGKSGGKTKKVREKKIVLKYINKSKTLAEKLLKTKESLPQNTTKDFANKIELERFIGFILKHIDLLERRIILEEKIPHEEKIFSIFEEYTEWISKGKRNIELGKKLSITSDQYGFILDYYVMNNESDSQIVEVVGERIKLNYINIFSWSYDKGYWHKRNKEYLQEFVEIVVMPKKGKKNKEEKEEESKSIFKKLRNKHSAVESNINELEHSGLNKCLDKGEDGFLRYIGLSVAAFNLKKAGKILMKNEIEKLKKSEKRKLKSASW